MKAVLSDEARWFVVHSQPHQERRAETNLRRQGFKTFLAQVEVTIRHGRRFETVVRPLFPRYLFIRLTVPGDLWRSVNGTFGVARLLTFGDIPQPLPIGFVEELLGSTGADGIVAPTLSVGETVTLTTGPFAGLTGKLLELAPSGRAQVMLSILGGERPVGVRAGAVVRAAA